MPCSYIYNVHTSISNSAIFIKFDSPPLLTNLVCELCARGGTTGGFDSRSGGVEIKNLTKMSFAALAVVRTGATLNPAAVQNNHHPARGLVLSKRPRPPPIWFSSNVQPK